jgi:hypothetical protein
MKKLGIKLPPIENQKISKSELKYLFGYARECGKKPAVLKEIAQALGHSSRKDILRGEIETVKLMLERW